MDSKKIYRIMSVLFLVLTILFFVLYANEKKNKNSLSDEFVTESVINLRSNEIEIDENIIDRIIPNKDIYCYTASSTEEQNELLTKEFTRALFNREVSTARFETPDGVSMRIYGNDSETELGKIVFNNSDSSFVFLKDGVNISGIEKPVLNNRTDFLTDDNIKFLSKICDGLTVGTKMDFRISGCSGDKEFFVVTAVQTVDGHDISDAFVNFSFDNDELVSVSGKWIIEEPKAKYNNTLIDGVNVLYMLDLQQIKSIDSQRIVYVVKTADSENCYLIPVWEVSYTDVNGEKVKELIDGI